MLFRSEPGARAVGIEESSLVEELAVDFAFLILRDDEVHAAW